MTINRRDEIDSSHYPVFHQMEGVKLFTPQEFKHVGATSDLEKRLYVEQHLKQGLEGMVRHIFGDVVSSFLLQNIDSNFLKFCWMSLIHMDSIVI